MAFSYKMVDTDLQQLFETIDNARKVSFDAMVSASKTDDRLTEMQMIDLKARLSAVNAQFTDLQRKISNLRNEAARQSSES